MEFTVEHGKYRWHGDFVNEKRRVVCTGTLVGSDGSRKPIAYVGSEREGEQFEPSITYCLGGKVVSHPQYGDQIDFTSYTCTVPCNYIGMTKYLQMAKEIGPRKANQLWAMYEDKAIDKIRDRSAHDEIASITKLTPRILSEAADFFDKKAMFQATMIRLIDMLDNTGIRKSIVDDLIKKFGVKAPHVVEHDTFELMKFPGVGFLKADKVFIGNGGDLSDLTRHMYAIVWSLKQDFGGHVWHEADSARKAAVKEIGDVRFEEALSLGIEREALAVKEIDGNRHVALYAQAKAEYTIAEQVSHYLTQGITGWPNLWDDENLTPHQKEAISQATTTRFGLLTGGPGCGKTFAVAAVIKAIHASVGKVLVCAPTGKAAKRCTEALSEYGINLEAITIHRACGIIPGDDGDYELRDTDLGVVQYAFVDESSMVENVNMAILLKKLPPNCHIMLIGDQNQLPPIGPGFPLRDMGDCRRVPQGKLVAVERNHGTIVDCCQAIRDEQRIAYVDEIEETLGHNLAYVPALTEGERIHKMFGILEELRSVEPPVDLIRDVMIVTPLNRVRKNLNERLQNFLNPHDGDPDDHRWRKGDPVICLKNGELIPKSFDRKAYDSGYKEKDCWVTVAGPNVKMVDGEPANSGTVSVVNGEIGTCVASYDSFAVVLLESGHFVMAAAFKDEYTNWDLAYAITAHKSQGSERPVVIVLAQNDGGAARVASRNWLYTAVSRAKRRCYLVGTINDMNKMMRRDCTYERMTDLNNEIEKQLNELIRV